MVVVGMPKCGVALVLLKWWKIAEFNLIEPEKNEKTIRTQNNKVINAWLKKLQGKKERKKNFENLLVQLNPSYKK